MIFEATLEAGCWTQIQLQPLINRKCLPRNYKSCKIEQTRKITTLAGSFITSEMVKLINIRLPELDKNKNINKKALVFDAEKF